MNWEEIDSENYDSDGDQRQPYSKTYRYYIPTGWLVEKNLYTYNHILMNSSITFVSDVNHEW